MTFKYSWFNDVPPGALATFKLEDWIAQRITRFVYQLERLESLFMQTYTHQCFVLLIAPWPCFFFVLESQETAFVN